ncbi:MAG: hypothetical protein H6728_02220 [Myxococcales bacterium]|nr:hypothetical protein [Myxococcales bacterium]
MQWPQPPLDHDHLLPLLWCPFLLWLALWGAWVPAEALGGFGLAWGQLGGGITLLLAFHGWLGGEGQRALSHPLQRGLGSFLPLLGVGLALSLILASLGKANEAAIALAISLFLGIWRARQTLFWIEKDSVWLGPFPLQRVRFASLRHVWAEGSEVLVRDDRERGFVYVAQDPQQAEEWAQTILAQQARWIEQHSEGFVAQRAGETWDISFGQGEDFFSSQGWSFSSHEEGHGASPSWGRGRKLLFVFLMGLWLFLWVSQKAASWGLVASWGRAIVHFVLGLGLCALVSALPWGWWAPWRASWVRKSTRRAAVLFLAVVWPSLIGLMLWAVWDLLRWRAGGSIDWTSTLLFLVSALAVARDPSGIFVWMARKDGRPQLRRLGWQESVLGASWEQVAFSHGMLFWKQGDQAFRMVLPCDVCAREVGAWLFGEGVEHKVGG